MNVIIQTDPAFQGRKFQNFSEHRSGSVMSDVQIPQNLNTAEISEVCSGRRRQLPVREKPKVGGGFGNESGTTGSDCQDGK